MLQLLCEKMLNNNIVYLQEQLFVNQSTSMQSKFLHIISFNIPYPPDYGGVIDVYYKILSLYEAGVKIILHCYQYGRQPSKELEKLCHKVYYYPRHSGMKYYLKKRPYIVSTRVSKFMPKNLLEDPFPVIFEGIHTTDLMLLCKEANKKVLFRAHNIEHEYYKYLAKSERNLFRRRFFLSESRKLKPYEDILKHADEILCISKNETGYFQEKFGKGIFLPAFHKYRSVQINAGSGEYILYHGNLSVAENEQAARFIVQKVISKTKYSLIIAGKGPSRKFSQWIGGFKNVMLIADPDETKISQLIRDAHINILFTFQPTGLKLKLLHSLFNGRHCVVNPEMVAGTGLEDLCHVVSNSDQAIRMINHLMNLALSDDEIKSRKTALAGYFNAENAEKIFRLLV